MTISIVTFCEGVKEYYFPNVFHNDCLAFPELFVVPGFHEIHVQNDYNVNKHLLIN